MVLLYWYAIVDQRTVVELRSYSIVEIRATVFDKNWVDVTDLDPRPQLGWTYDGETFSPPSE